jgi:hypothetical protein
LPVNAEMLGEEIEELFDVAPIGLQRLGRIAPLGAQMGEPVLNLGGELGRCRAARPLGSGDPALFCLSVRTGFPLERE